MLLQGALQTYMFFPKSLSCELCQAVVPHLLPASYAIL